MKTKKLLKRIKFRSRRNLDRLGIYKWDGENITEPYKQEAIDDEHTDETIFGDSFSQYTEDELDDIVKTGIDKIKSKPQNDGEESSPNFIVDVCILHFGANEFGTALGLLDEDKAVSTVRSLDDAFRNKGVHYDSEGTDSGMNFGLGQVKYLDGSEVWGDFFRPNGGTGINYNNISGQGPSSGEVMEYIKKNVMNSWGDGTRYLIVSFPKINGSSGIAGYAWLGNRATDRIAGSFVKYSYMGHKDYIPNPFFSRTNKTAIHEVGHSLGLFHTFNNTTSCVETNPALQGDRVLDTPAHTQYDRCGYSLTELPHNSHMSYSSQSLRKIFSPGQVDRMKAVAVNQYELMYQNPYYEWTDEETPDPILGCTNPEAKNYNPEATEDDGSCIMEKLGCTDSAALNYDPEANEDDGSCQYDNPGEKTYRQGDNVLKEQYNSDNDMYFEAIITFDEDPEGIIYECGGSGTGTLVGFNDDGNFVARSGEGGSMNPETAAKILVSPTEYDFSGKSGLLRYEVFIDKKSVRIQFDEGNTGSFDFEKIATAVKPFTNSNWSGGDDGGVGFANGNSISGPEVEEPATFTGTIESLVFSQNPVIIRGCTNPLATNYNLLANEDDDTCEFPLPDRIILDLGNYTFKVEENQVIIEKVD